MPVIGRISVGDGATFTPAIDSDGVLTFSNNKNLPNPEPFDVPGSVINSGAMTPGSENGTIAFGGNDVAVTGWDTKANVASPAFTGTPTAPTQTDTDDSTKLATTSFVQSAKSGAVTTANAYTDEQIRQHGNLPVGYEYFTFNPSIPQGSLPLFGGEYDRATYSDLWAWVQTQTGYLKTEAEWQTLSASNNGNVPYYSSGDGSTTFRVPSLKCWVRGANGTVSEVGSYLAAGLPNITGSIQTRTLNDSTTIVPGYSGAFGNGGRGSTGASVNTALQSTAREVYVTDFNASLSSSIYGNSTTVQPESIVGMWLVKAYGVIVDTGQIDEQAYIDDRFNASKQYTDDKVAPIGNTVSNSISASVTGSASQEKTICNITLAEGVWVVTGHIKFTGTVASRLYGASVSETSNSVSSANDGSMIVQSSTANNLALEVVKIVNMASGGTYYLNAYSDNSYTVANADIKAVRII